MMKRVLVLLMVVLLSACGTSDPAQTTENTINNNNEDTTNVIYDGPVVYLCSKIESYHEDGSEYETYEFEYYDSGRVKKCTQTIYSKTHYDMWDEFNTNIDYPCVNVSEFAEDEELGEAYYDDSLAVDEGIYYDEKGRVTHNYSYAFGGIYYVYKYDDNGNLIKNGTISARDEYEKPISADINTIYDKLDTDAWWYTEYEYDQYNRLVKTTDSGRAPEYSHIITIDYDDNGNIAKRTAYDMNNNMTGWLDYSYIAIPEEKANLNDMTINLLEAKTTLFARFYVEPDYQVDPY